jgi:hypothetical protein
MSCKQLPVELAQFRKQSNAPFLVDATYTAAAKQCRHAFSGSGIGRHITGRFAFEDFS